MISVITPHYRETNPFIEECYDSLTAQTLQDWDWVIVLNNGGVLPEVIHGDPRVIAFNAPEHTKGIGALKRLACEQAGADIVVELDADDLLVENALETVQRAFEHPRVHFVHSNCARFVDGLWDSPVYDSYWGWTSRPFKYQGHALREMRAFPATPHAMRSVYWAPNHLRAWRLETYWRIGGHNRAFPVIDDYDLCCRFFLHGPLTHIDECLYLYREYFGQTSKRQQPLIQKRNSDVYTQQIIPMVEAWAKREDLLMLDLGAAHDSPLGYTGIDLHDAPVIHNLQEGLPYDDSSVGVVRAYDFLEHIPSSKVVHLMNEIHRVLVPGGWLLASVPSTDGRGAFQAPDHVSFWNENSFWYYTDPKYAKYVLGLTARFQTSRVLTWFPSKFHKAHNISYVDAQLIAVKPGYNDVGECPGVNHWRDNGSS